LASLRGSTHALAEIQSGVEKISYQALGQWRHTPGDRRRVQDHEVDVRIGGYIPPAVSTMGHESHFTCQGVGVAQVGQSSLAKIADHQVEQFGPSPANLDAWRTLLVPAFELLAPLDQPFLGRQNVRSQS
jgi:hypothetical protein